MSDDRVQADQRRLPTLAESMAPLLGMAVFLGVGYGVLRLPSEVLLIAAAGVAGIIARRLGYSYKEIENGILTSMMKGMPAMLIVIVVGALIGSWIACGTIPMLIYYGLELMSPTYFLLTACLVCSVVSLVTGTSYGTVGTLGVDTLAYAPWAVMCYLGFVLALIYGFTGFAIAPRIHDDETVPGS